MDALRYWPSVQFVQTWLAMLIAILPTTHTGHGSVDPCASLLVPTSQGLHPVLSTVSEYLPLAQRWHTTVATSPVYFPLGQESQDVLKRNVQRWNIRAR